MANIKLIESLRSIKRMTTNRYNGLKIKTITYWLYSSYVDLTTNTNSRYFPTWRHFEAPPFLGKF